MKKEKYDIVELMVIFTSPLTYIFFVYYGAVGFYLWLDRTLWLTSIYRHLFCVNKSQTMEQLEGWRKSSSFFAENGNSKWKRWVAKKTLAKVERILTNKTKQ